MPKKIFFSAFLLAGILSVAACGGEGGNEEPAAEPLPQAVSTETEQVAPEAVQGTVQMDTAGAGAIVDTSLVPAAADTGSH